MKIEPKLIKATLLKRYKRFLADVRLASGDTITVHCPNTGSMKRCVVEGSDCWISDSNNLKRKYRHTWELATTEAGAIACVNTHKANALVVEAIENGVLAELQGYSELAKEKRYGVHNSRIDILLSNDHESCFVEVKSMTLEGDDDPKLGRFPDSVSDRATKHLLELMEMKKQGHRAVLVFCVQHSGIEVATAADDIDPVYGKTLRQAISQGVEVFAYKALLDDAQARLTQSIPFVLR